MRLNRRKNELTRKPYSGGDYRQLLTLEKERSERYNHFFALFGLCLEGRGDEDFSGFVRAQLRSSDYVFRVPPAGRERSVEEQLGVLLPETDQAGAQVVKERLAQLCLICKVPVRLGLAVYPDNGTIPEQLLAEVFRTCPVEG
jgi:hypothetical protein